MNVNPIVDTQRSGLIGLETITTVKPETIAEIWEAAEAFISPELTRRIWGLNCLIKQQAIYISPLVAYLMATRLAEPDIELRSRIVHTLANTLSPMDRTTTVQEAVVNVLNNYLKSMRTRMIFSLIQVVDFDKSLEPDVAALLSVCSFAGGHLADILANRDISINIRKQAAIFIGRIGFLDALPAMEKIAFRMESRKNNWNSSFNDNDDELYILVQDALLNLRAP